MHALECAIELRETKERIQAWCVLHFRSNIMFKIVNYREIPAIMFKEYSGKRDYAGKDGGWVVLVVRNSKNPEETVFLEALY